MALFEMDTISLQEQAKGLGTGLHCYFVSYHVERSSQLMRGLHVWLPVYGYGKTIAITLSKHTRRYSS